MKSVLFLCVANSARSQMAEGLARKVFGDTIQFQSAGSKPTAVNPYAVRVMKEFGVDISSQRSKPVSEIAEGSFDTAIYLCAEEACPIGFENVPRRLWQLPDPAGTLGSDEHILQAFRETRDRLYAKLMSLQKELRPQ